MSDTIIRTDTETRPHPTASKRGFLGQMELDLHLLGMIGAFVVICLILRFLTGGLVKERVVFWGWLPP
jgi:D-xylose transport system permease protein